MNIFHVPNSDLQVSHFAGNNIMIDIETMGTERDAIILSIGACNISADPAYKFYVEINPDQADRRIEPKTVLWWIEQERKGIPIPCKGTIELESALAALNKFILTLSPEPIIWCKGTDFDTSILEHAFKSINVCPAWKLNGAYNRTRDLRTLIKFYGASPKEVVREGVVHNALDDAIFQAKQLAYITWMFGKKIISLT